MNKIEILAKRIIDSQSFEYDSFSDAKNIIEEDAFWIEYDRLSLGIYSHNLCEKDYRILSRHLKHLFDDRTDDVKKWRREYYMLLKYSEFRPELLTAKVIKEEHPDFLIQIGKKNIGIEVTALALEYDKKIEKTVHESFGRGLNAEQIKQLAVQRHGVKQAEYYEYFDFGPISGIEAGVRKINNEQQKYIQQINKKIKKYRDKAEDFDEFIILCDAIYSMAIMDKNDAKEVFEYLDRNIKNTTISILATSENDTSKLVVYNRTVDGETK